MYRRSIQIAAFLLVFVFIQSLAPAGEAQSAATTVILVRHAEKGAAPPNDPPLSAAGRARAAALARTLEHADIKAIYASQFARTHETGRPLAEKLGLTVSVLPIALDPARPPHLSRESIDRVLEKVLAHSGQTILIVGHSNTIPDLIEALGGGAMPEIDEQTYDDLFIVTVLEKGKARVVHLKYGEPR